MIYCLFKCFGVTVSAAFQFTPFNRGTKLAVVPMANYAPISEGVNDETRPRSIFFRSPLLDYGYLPVVEEYESGSLARKPLLLYLPGFDGSFLSAFLQYPELSTAFDVRCMSIPASDRSTFNELKRSVLQYLRMEIAESIVGDLDQRSSRNKTQPILSSSPFDQIFSFTKGASSKAVYKRSSRSVYLVGESFGGLLASEIALSILESEKSHANSTIDLQGLVLVNPATCYDRSRLAALGPPVANSVPWMYPANLAKLLPLFTDEYSLAQLRLIVQAKALPSVIDDAPREAYLGRVALSLPFIFPSMPQATLSWRLSQLLEFGCASAEQRLTGLAAFPSFRVLIVAGEFDACLPSIDEAERLVSGVLPNAKVHVVEGAGHASTCGSRMDLTAVMRNCFVELQQKNGRRSVTLRTAMKNEAASGIEEYFGMQPRYDNATIGLNPLRYWSPGLYLKHRPKTGPGQRKISRTTRHKG